MTHQLQHWLVCQFCGAAAPKGSDGWLDQPRRGAWDGTRIRRCPQHWSEWALRQTREGRTKQNRERMQRALAMPVPLIPPHLSPFPMEDKEA